MNLATSVRTCFSKYVTFSGRARRSEYWWFVLFYFVGNTILPIADGILFGTATVSSNGFATSSTPVLSGLFMLATLLPLLSVLVRRLHDLGKSGWWYWIILVPLVGIFVLIYWLASEGTEGDNRFGTRNGQDAGSDAGKGLVDSEVPTVLRSE